MVIRASRPLCTVYLLCGLAIDASEAVTVLPDLDYVREERYVTRRLIPMVTDNMERGEKSKVPK